MTVDETVWSVEVTQDFDDTHTIHTQLHITHQYGQTTNIFIFLLRFLASGDLVEWTFEGIFKKIWRQWQSVIFGYKAYFNWQLRFIGIW